MNMPSINDRTNIEFDEMDDKKLRIMVGFTEAVLKSLCQIVYPTDSNKLAAAVASKLSGGGRKVGDAFRQGYTHANQNNFFCYTY
jgi:hypothetical protein